MEQYVNELLVALVLALVGVMTYLLKGLASVAIAYLNNKIGADKVQFAGSLVEVMVRAVQQSPEFSELDGAAKKEQVLARAQTLLAKYGINMSHDELDKLVEAAVQVMKSELASGPPQLPE